MSNRETNFASPNENLLCKKQKYVRGVKRNQIIQRWLQGIEDPMYEVFPTKKEGKYIVKLRENKIIDQSDEKLNDTTYSTFEDNSQNEVPSISDITETNESEDVEPEITKIHQKTTPSAKIKCCVRTPSTQCGSRVNYNQTDSISMLRNTKNDGNVASQTINLEILEQLKNLGEELRNDRFKKEQKQYIKQIVNKELSKSRIRSKYVPDIFQDDDTSYSAKADDSLNKTPTMIDDKQIKLQESESVIETPNPEPDRHVFRSRIRR